MVSSSMPFMEIQEFSSLFKILIDVLNDVRYSGQIIFSPLIPIWWWWWWGGQHLALRDTGRMREAGTRTLYASTLPTGLQALQLPENLTSLDHGVAHWLF